MVRTPKVANLEFHEAGWDQLITSVVQKWAVPRAEAIAEAANAHVAAQAEALLAEPETEDPYADATPADRVRVENAKARRRKARAVQHFEPPEGKRDYMVSVEGSNPLSLKDYRATVITVTDRAKIDNARNNTLIGYLHQAGG